MTNGEAERTEGFVKLPRSVVERLGQLSTAAWRVLVFLLLELLRNGGRRNGQLKAPHRQLIASGISASLISSAIKELEAANLVRCRRPRTRAANLFELTWLPRSEGHVRQRLAATINGGRFA